MVRSSPPSDRPVDGLGLRHPECRIALPDLLSAREGICEEGREVPRQASELLPDSALAQKKSHRSPWVVCLLITGLMGCYYQKKFLNLIMSRKQLQLGKCNNCRGEISNYKVHVNCASVYLAATPSLLKAAAGMGAAGAPFPRAKECGVGGHLWKGKQRPEGVTCTQLSSSEVASKWVRLTTLGTKWGATPGALESPLTLHTHPQRSHKQDSYESIHMTVYLFTVSMAYYIWTVYTMYTCIVWHTIHG